MITVTLLLLCLLKAESHVTVMQITEVRRENFETSCVRIIPEGSIHFEEPAPWQPGTQPTCVLPLFPSYPLFILTVMLPPTTRTMKTRNPQALSWRNELFELVVGAVWKFQTMSCIVSNQFWGEKKLLADYPHNQEHNTDPRTYHRSLATRESEWVLSSW